MEFKKLSDDLNVKLLKGTRSSIFYMKDYIDNGENLKIKPIVLKTKKTFSLGLPFGILSFSSYVDIEETNFLNVELNEYNLLGTKSPQKNS